MSNFLYYFKFIILDSNINTDYDQVTVSTGCSLRESFMDYAALNTFVTVVEEGSFSRASEKLLRTQPAVSLAVRRLETELEETLIDRSSRRLKLTDSGEVALEFGRRFRHLERQMLRSLRELRDLAAGRLLIGANESSTLYLLAELRRFRGLFPKIHIRVQRCRSSEIPEQLIDGELELGVISYDPGRPELVTKVIYEDHLAFIVSPDHPLAEKKSISIAELGNETFIAHNVVSPYRRVVLRKFQEQHVPLNMDVEMPTVEAIRKLVQRNEGVAFLPRMCVDQEIRQGSLQEIRVRELFVERQIRLVYPKTRTLSRAAEAFLDLLTNQKT
jgi:DNA-binding transcriptional LysR family regulator